MKLVRLATLTLLVAGVSAHAFVVELDGSNRMMRWNLLTPSGNTNLVNPNTHAVRFFLASDAYSATNTAAELNAIRASFGQWQAVPGTHLKFEDGGLVAPGADINLSDNTNVVFWTRNGLVNGGTVNIGGALGYTMLTADANNNILQADIVLNAAFTNIASYAWFTDFNSLNSSNSFVEAVASHEIGHFIGLKHSPLGGATMRYAGLPGVNPQAGLCADEIGAARHLYPVAATNYGAVKGTVTRAGVPILGVAVFAQDSATNIAGGTVTRSDGTYLLGTLSPGDYLIRVAPLDPGNAAYFLCRGADINANYSSAVTTFLPTTNVLVTVAAKATNTINFAVETNEPAFRITHIRKPGPSGGYTYSSAPYTIRAGQSNWFTGVASTNLPNSGATLKITGDGLTLGSPTYSSVDVDFSAATVMGTLISCSISVASNATPGLRSFIVQHGTNIAYANGYLEVLPPITDNNFDGLDDIFQRQYFALFTSPQAAAGADPDGDKFSNYAEYLSGTVPTNAASYLKILSTTTAANGTTVRWCSANGKRYQLSSRADFISPWQNAGAPIIGAGTNTQYLDVTATNGARFYRVEALP